MGFAGSQIFCLSDIYVYWDETIWNAVFLHYTDCSCSCLSTNNYLQGSHVIWKTCNFILYSSRSDLLKYMNNLKFWRPNLEFEMFQNYFYKTYIPFHLSLISQKWWSNSFDMQNYYFNPALTWNGPEIETMCRVRVPLCNWLRSWFTIISR